MGEIIEFSTWPRHKNTFYKITSNGINFEIKAPGNAGIGLASQPGPTCEFLVGIGHHRRTWIKKISTRVVEKIDTPNILSSQEFRRFWVSWYGNLLRVGIDGTPKPIVTLNNKNSNLKYVTFFSIEDNNSHAVYWKIELPPVLERPLVKPVTGGELYWVEVDSDTQFPDGAYIGGYERENLYIIRANHMGSLTPGKFVSSEGVGYIPWGGESNAKDSFQVLCGFDCTWVPSTSDNIPVGAVIGGHSEDNGHERLYIGRVKYLGHIIPGKVQPTHKVCYIAYGDKEIAMDSYEIMVVPEKNRSANKFLVLPIKDSMFESDDENEDSNSLNYEDFDHND